MIIKSGLFREEPKAITHHLNFFLHDCMQLHDIPGLSLAVIEGQTINTFEWGVKNSFSKELVTPETVFEAASLTKPLVAYLALKLCEMGILQLDHTLPLLTEDLPPITLRQILSHTAGFPSANRMAGESLSLMSPPGSSFAYSGEGYSYLGRVIEDLTKTPLAVLMKELVFIPLHMKESSLIWEDKYDTQAAFPHNRAGQATEKWKPLQAIASFSLHTTALDFAKFMLASQKVPTMLNINVPINSEIGWSLGWGVETTARGKSCWHSGDNGTFHSFAFFNELFGFVMMANSANAIKIIPQVLHFLAPGRHPLIEWEKFDVRASEERDEDFLANWWKIYGI